ncbi:MAG: DUF2852 domain-containing protein [Brevundimonas sp.]|jgi:hypothetical protein
MNTALIKPQWGPLTIGLMVLGFILWWPLGLAVLGYIVWGENFGGSAEKAQRMMDKGRSFARNCAPRGSWNRQGFRNTSGNAAFDDYREEQLRRLDEERRRLDEEINAFHEYMSQLRQAKDREEFDRFMRDRNGSRQGFGPTTDNGSPTS